jgi:hypothetical protein
VGKFSRDKGIRAEREALHALGDRLGEQLARNLTQTRKGGDDCTEVRGWAIEIKHCERLSRPAWWRQACEQSKRRGVEPMLLFRRNREPWTAWVHTRDGAYRETDMDGAANAIREKWMRWP